MRSGTHLIRLAVVFVHVALSAGIAVAAEAQSPLDVYRGHTQYGIMLCSATVKLALLRAQGDTPQDQKSDYRGCISKSKAEARTGLNDALRFVKKPKARDALKSVHVAFTVALEGVAPGLDERRISYEQRQRALEDKLTEAWARFEIEE